VILPSSWEAHRISGVAARLSAEALSVLSIKAAVRVRKWCAVASSRVAAGVTLSRGHVALVGWP
jgi:hypothetical protein